MYEMYNIDLLTCKTTVPSLIESLLLQFLVLISAVLNGPHQYKGRIAI